MTQIKVHEIPACLILFLAQMEEKKFSVCHIIKNIPTHARHVIKRNENKNVY